MPKKTRKQLRIWLMAIFVVVFSIQLIYLMSGFAFPVLQPSGWVGEQQRNLIVFTMLLSLVVIVPVFYMLFRFITKYDEKNTKAKYQPELDNNKAIEFIWWGVPIVLVLILGVITYRTSHSLDPFKAIDHPKEQLTIQVIALQWKWLFIYPDQQIATVNYVKLPVDRPVEFKLTGDKAPMNSFWIPDLGGQLYAMEGMATELNLIANKAGDYKGVSSNLSGEGFAGMKFIASAVNETEFNNWISEKQLTGELLTDASYEDLTKPSSNNLVTSYKLENPNLFEDTIHKYMSHGSSMYDSNTMQEAHGGSH